MEGEHPIADASSSSYPHPVNILIPVILLFVVFGGGGPYLGGPDIGGGGVA
jgi:hypothetical protein